MQSKNLHRILKTASRPCSLALLLLLCAVPARAALTDGLISHWPLNVDEGGSTPDVVFTNGMTVVGFPIVEAGMVDNAYVFDGATTYLENRHSATPESGLPIYKAGTYTISMWVKGPAQAGKYLFAEGSSASTAPLFILQTGTGANSGKFDVIIRPDTGAALVNHVVSTATVFDDTWHHIAWVDDNGNARLYVDGVLDSANFTYTPGGNFTLDVTAIGTLIRTTVATGSIFSGAMDEVAVWERALTEEEVTTVFTSGIPAPSSDVPPTLESQPGDVTKNVGDWHIFTANVSGTRPMTFQWLRDDVEIPGATEQSYRASNLTFEDSGAVFTLRVSNALGSVTTDGATLTVLADPEPDVQAGLINYWPLDEIEQEADLLTSPDLYSLNDMVLQGFFDPTDFVEGHANNALFFNFVDRYTYRTNGSPVYNNTNFSVSIWVKGAFETQNDKRVFSEGSSTDNDPLFTIGTDSAGLSPVASFYIRDDSGAGQLARKSTRAVFDDTWHHLVWTDANGQARLYIDGEMDETDFAYTRSTLTLDQTSLGAVLRAVAGNHFFGSIDEVATWNRVLSWTEIQEIFSEGIPAPAGAVAPAITTQPVNPFGGVFVGDTVTYSIQTTGTLPLAFQWKKDDADINGAANPSALTDTLTLENVQVSDSGVYTVSVSNSGGSVTSAEVALTVQPHVPPVIGTVLKVDVGPGTVQAGFDQFTLAMNGSSYDGIKLTVSGLNAPLAERSRANVVDNPPNLTQASIYNDFIFANNTVDGNGLRVLIERLAPSTPYTVRVWSYDPVSAGDRLSDWSETSSETPVPIVSAYTFNGSVLPVNDLDYTWNAVLTSSPTGTLQIDAVKNGGTQIAAFLNAIEITGTSDEPAPIEIAAPELVEGNIRLTIQKTSEDQVINIEQRSALGAGVWEPATGGTLETVGNVVTAEFPSTEGQMFYRVVAP